MSAASPEAVADAMFSRDRASRGLGMRIEEVAAGRSRLSMEVNEGMLNGYDVCHGGMIFALADSAFAFASNAGDDVVFAAGCDIEYLRPARRGDRLTASARLPLTSGRTSYFDVEVTNQSQETVAVFRRRGRRIGGRAAPPDDREGKR